LASSVAFSLNLGSIVGFGFFSSNFFLASAFLCAGVFFTIGSSCSDVFGKTAKTIFLGSLATGFFGCYNLKFDMIAWDIYSEIF
jgi:hypothetical protein